MTSISVIVDLPDSLAREAKERGLLSPEAIEGLLREELRRQRASEFFQITDELASDSTPPMTADEIDKEIEVARADRRVRNADRG